MIELAIKNLSQSVSDIQLKAALPSFQRQVSEHFFSVHGIDARLHFFEKTRSVPVNHWPLNLYENAESAGYLGFHDLSSAGKPLGKVYVGTTIKYGGLWTVTFSHELLEMLLDPWINYTVPDIANKRSLSLEACDAVEADELGYKIDGVQVSDFLKPSYWEPDVAAKNRSWMGHVTSAFSLAPGGYNSFLRWDTGEWDQETAQKVPHDGKHSRQARRVKPHSERRVSTAE